MSLFQLAGVMGALIVVSVIRRIYDTRVFGTVRVEVGKTQATRASAQPVSILNARLGMGRELVDFLEVEAPLVMTAVVQITISVVVLYMFDATLALAAGCTVVVMLAIYGLFHKRFYRLSGVFNGQTERQVAILEARKHPTPVDVFITLAAHGDKDLRRRICALWCCLCRSSGIGRF